VSVCNFSGNRDMKRLITVLNTTLQLQKQAKPGRPVSASSDQALSSVVTAQDDNSDVALVRPPASKPVNFGVTFVKASPTVISVPPSPPVDETDDGCYGTEPRFQLGAFFIHIGLPYQYCLPCVF